MCSSSIASSNNTGRVIHEKSKTIRQKHLGNETCTQESGQSRKKAYLHRRKSKSIYLQPTAQDGTKNRLPPKLVQPPMSSKCTKTKTRSRFIVHYSSQDQACAGCQTTFSCKRPEFSSPAAPGPHCVANSAISSSSDSDKARHGLGMVDAGAS